MELVLFRSYWYQLKSLIYKLDNMAVLVTIEKNQIYKTIGEKIKALQKFVGFYKILLPVACCLKRQMEQATGSTVENPFRYQRAKINSCPLQFGQTKQVEKFLDSRAYAIALAGLLTMPVVARWDTSHSA